MNTRTNTLIMRGLSATEAKAQATREAIRDETQRYGFDRVASRYGEGEVRAAWLPEN